ncbi:MAG: DUF924 family protein [Alteripontixanthobacter sp.]
MTVADNVPRAPGTDLPRWAADLLHVWFHDLAPSDWFKPSETIDSMLHRRFGDTLEAMAARRAGDFTDNAELAQAAILLFDQVPRNIHRQTPRAFATDKLAVEIAKSVIEQGWDNSLPDAQRQFIAMPLMHSEDIADQEASLAYFGKYLPGNLSFARSHHEMIAHFGRFPHRNDVLGRETTEAEQRAIDEGFSW